MSFKKWKREKWFDMKTERIESGEYLVRFPWICLGIEDHLQPNGEMWSEICLNSTTQFRCLSLTSQFSFPMSLFTSQCLFTLRS